MKNLLFPGLPALTLVVALGHHVAMAQTDPRNRISVNFGGGTSPEFIDTEEDILESIFTQGTKTENTAFSGAFSIQYERQVSSRFAAGVSFIYEGITKDVVITDPSDVTMEEAYEATYPTVLVDGAYAYVSKPKMELFGRLGLGLSFVKEEITVQGETTTDNSVLFAYQISPIGIRLGKKVFFKSELGFGYLGILSVGAGLRF